jgi:hypothetical protein
MPTRKVILDGNIPVVQMCKADLDKLMIDMYGKTYIMYHPGNSDEDTSHMIYKLHCIDGKWYWVALWNSGCVYSCKETFKSGFRGKFIKSWDSIEEALSIALKEGIQVRQINGDNLESLKWAFK